MNFSQISSILQGVPYISANNARRLYDFVCKVQPRDCLELGFAHGTSSLYIAAALDEIGGGHLTSVDIPSSAALEPTIEDQIEKTGLGRYVTVVRETTSYTWFLKKQLERRAGPCYDFCFIDGAKNWTIDSCAFFLVDRLLRRNGWVLFDDYNWTYAEQERRSGKRVSDGVTHRELGRDELEQPHVKLIFDLLVTTHPDYSEFQIDDDIWAWAHKVRGDDRTLTLSTNSSLTAIVVKAARRARAALGRRPSDR